MLSIKKVLLPFLAISLGTGTLCADQPGSLGSYATAGTHYLFSSDGLKDIAAAYGLVMAGTLIHELGHAFTAKALCGVPVDVVLGGPRRKDSPWKIGGVEFAGFNPLFSDARWEERHPEDKDIYPHVGSKKDSAVLLAGPLMQAITGICAYAWLRKKEGCYLAKVVALGLLVDTIVGINGIYGANYVAWSDPAKLKQNLQQEHITTNTTQTNV